MAFDTTTRKRLSDFVADARRVLTEEFAEQLQSLYGISVTGDIAPLERLTHLDAEGLELAATLRQRIVYLTSASPEARDATKAAVDRLTREQAFTVLNRLAAIRMAEKRGLIVESVGQQYQSKGFKVFESVAGSAIGETYDRYRCYLFCLFDELAIDLGALFDQRSPQALLFPREKPLLALLGLLDDTDLQDLWAEDETIGWIYQYYNDPAERKKMREESAAPRNSRELAVRNQFFTPRYVVEFLTDNTLGRIWYEMTQGGTTLKEQCRYLVRRPTEIFLKPGESPPEQPKQDGLSQEDLLKQPVFIPHRPLKDPRSILMLDPACGSMHFGLYAFDLFEAIYEEAWEIATGSDETAKSGELFAPFCAFAASFSDKAAFRREVPRMIVEHNLHGIDIDPRAAQIAALSLWLRAQRAWNAVGMKPVDRPRITRSNIVCAEPMPGDKSILAEFVEQQFPEGERPAFGFLLETVFDRMTLAGEAGSLLKIEEEIRTAIAKAKKLWEKEPQLTQRMLFSGGEDNPGDTQKTLDLSGITDEQFWAGAEERIYAALSDYAEQAESGDFQRRLFVDDAARGFAFIDICRQSYDVALMNPPFGDASEPSKPYLAEIYGDTKGDIYKAFVECAQQRLFPAGMVGVISSRTGFFLEQSADWRERVLLRLFRPLFLADLGHGVLDAMVETAAYVLRSLSAGEAQHLIRSILKDLARSPQSESTHLTISAFATARGGELKRRQIESEIAHLIKDGYLRDVTTSATRMFVLTAAARSENLLHNTTRSSPLICFRLLKETDKEDLLLKMVRGEDRSNQFTLDYSALSMLPGKPFAYWISAEVASLFTSVPPFQSEARWASAGVSTGDDFRFLRCWWEVGPQYSKQTLGLVDPKNPCAYSDTEEGATQPRWIPYAKGGEYSPFYDSIHLVLNWDAGGREMYAAVECGTLPGARIQGTSNFLKPGVTWPGFTTSRLSARPLPAGCGYAQVATTVFPRDPKELAWLSCMLNSDVLYYLMKVSMGLGDSGRKVYGVGNIQKIPFPPTVEVADSAVQSHHDLLAVILLRVRHDETDRNCVTPEIGPGAARGVREREVARSTVRDALVRINECACDAYGITSEARAEIENSLERDREALLECAENQILARLPERRSFICDGLVGYVFGRWDIRYATGEQAAPDLPDPFAPLPACPPGQLQNTQGLPAGPEEVPAAYPLKNIPWDGILVDDPNHPLDIEQRIREVIEIIWNGKGGGPTAEANELEACEILRVKSLRDYFRKPGNFFADHLKRYSKSRRQAPIYWPLSTKSGSYTLWIYYHRLNDQTLHKCLADFLDPKIKDVENELGKLAGKDSGRAADLRDFLNELKDLKDEIERVIKLPWKPNLNDGVLITASPLWKLFRLSKWQKDLKACWEELEKGDYDWSHLAYTIWPERVEKVCEKDRSIAIAHGLEHLCKIEPPKPKKPRGKKASS
jgi:hypothetical protein